MRRQNVLRWAQPWPLDSCDVCGTHLGVLSTLGADTLPAAGRQLLVPAPVVAEVGYLPACEAGTRVESLFLSAFARRPWICDQTS